MVCLVFFNYYNLLSKQSKMESYNFLSHYFAFKNQGIDILGQKCFRAVAVAVGQFLSRVSWSGSLNLIFLQAAANIVVSFDAALIDKTRSTSLLKWSECGDAFLLQSISLAPVAYFLNQPSKLTSPVASLVAIILVNSLFGCCSKRDKC